MADLVEVAFVGDEFQGAMIQALLQEHGIQSLLQQVTPSGPQVGYGLMNPGGGARRVLVNAENADRARALVEAAMAAQVDRRLRESVFLVVSRDGGAFRGLPAGSRPRSHLTAMGPRTISRR
jgi:hypothetical protein